MASETSAIALRSEEIRKEMPIATASGGGVANLSHDLFFILLYNITNFFVCSEIGFIASIASIYTLSLCRGHSWRVRLAKQETLTPPGHLVSPLVCRGP